VDETEERPFDTKAEIRAIAEFAKAADLYSTRPGGASLAEVFLNEAHKEFCQLDDTKKDKVIAALDGNARKDGDGATVSLKFDNIYVSAACE
jgi:hypothetical protein